MPLDSPKRPRSDQWVLLSALRFVLAAIVLCGHCRYVIPDIANAPALIRLGAYLGGMPSVYGFFLVSGYSIAASLDQDAHGFYLRRIARIYPTYWACFAFAFAVSAIIGLAPFKIGGGMTILLDHHHSLLLLNAIGLPCLFTRPIATFVTSWSLTCEIIYYSLAPLLRRFSSKILLTLACISFVICVAHQDNDWGKLTHGYPVVALAGYWLAGFVFYRHRGNPLAAPVFVGAIVALYSLNWNSWEPYGCVNLLVSTLAIVYAREIHLPLSIGKIFTYLGEISYPLYLVHWPVYLLLYWRFHETLQFHPNAIFIYLVCAIISAVIVYHVIDRPARKFVLKIFGFQKPLATMHTSAQLA